MKPINWIDYVDSAIRKYKSGNKTNPSSFISGSVWFEFQQNVLAQWMLKSNANKLKPEIESLIGLEPEESKINEWRLNCDETEWINCFRHAGIHLKTNPNWKLIQFH